MPPNGQVMKRESSAGIQEQGTVNISAIVASSIAGGFFLSLVIGLVVYLSVNIHRCQLQGQQLLVGAAVQPLGDKNNVAPITADIQLGCACMGGVQPETMPSHEVFLSSSAVGTDRKQARASLHMEISSTESSPRGDSPILGSMHGVKDIRNKNDNFDPFLQNIQEKAPSLAEFDPDSQSPTQVLLLDSGIDANHKLLEIFVKEGQIKPWRNFGVHGTKSLEDTNGHGTACAFLIASISHGIIVYSGRVCEGGKDGVPIARDVAQAIFAAANEQDSADGVKFDIIVIPIGFPKEDPELSHAVQVGLNKRILIIAAAGNEGDSCSTYPADYDGVIAACSSDYLGNKSRFSASMNEKNNAPFYILGENLIVPWASSTGEKTSTELKSGTSFSAAILAGICAALLQITSDRPQDKLMLRDSRKMRQVLGLVRRANAFNPEGFDDKLVSHNGLMSP
ncbi:Tk-subtilisin [Orbilia brochopaga]|nr:Tk-subtilisin [Drechslerella brochopaga]